MNRRRLLFIGIAALALGSLVSLKVYRMLQAQSGPPKLADPLIPPDMRAVSIDVTSLGAAGFVAPGTRVDVLATVNFSGSNEPRNVTILQNVKVIASGRRLDHGSLAAQVVTLVVSPEDAEKLALAMQEGHQLTLRNVDTKQETTPPGNENLHVPRVNALCNQCQRFRTFMR